MEIPTTYTIKQVVNLIGILTETERETSDYRRAIIEVRASQTPYGHLVLWVDILHVFDRELAKEKRFYRDEHFYSARLTINGMTAYIDWTSVHLDLESNRRYNGETTEPKHLFSRCLDHANNAEELAGMMDTTGAIWREIQSNSTARKLIGSIGDRILKGQASDAL